MKLCIDCRHYAEQCGGECHHPKNYETDLVRGGKHMARLPHHLRQNHALVERDVCGVDAHWFESKPKIEQRGAGK